LNEKHSEVFEVKLPSACKAQQAAFEDHVQVGIKIRLMLSNMIATKHRDAIPEPEPEEDRDQIIQAAVKQQFEKYQNSNTKYVPERIRIVSTEDALQAKLDAISKVTEDGKTDLLDF